MAAGWLLAFTLSLDDLVIASFATGPGARAIGPAAEAAGFESVWTVEHVLYPEGYEST